LLVSVCACSAVWYLARPTRDYGQCSIQDAPRPNEPGYARWVEECRLEKLRAQQQLQKQLLQARLASAGPASARVRL